MLFDWNAVAAPASVQDLQLSAPRTLSGEGLWVCLVSSGKCTASVPMAGPLPVGAALLLPPQSVPAGHLVLSRAPLALAPEGSCHLLCIQLTGQAAGQFLAGLHQLPFRAKGSSCPAAAELMGRLDDVVLFDPLGPAQLAAIADRLLCELEERAARQGYTLRHTPAAAAALAGDTVPAYGARELRRKVSRAVEQALADRIAAGTARPGVLFVADAAPDGHITLTMGDVAACAS